MSTNIVTGGARMRPMIPNSSFEYEARDAVEGHGSQKVLSSSFKPIHKKQTRVKTAETYFHN